MRLVLVARNTITGADIGYMLARFKEGIDSDVLRDILGIWLYEISDEDYDTFGQKTTYTWDDLVSKYVTLKTIHMSSSTTTKTSITSLSQFPDTLPGTLVQHILSELTEKQLDRGDIVHVKWRAARPYGTWEEPWFDYFEIEPHSAQWATVDIWAPALGFRERVSTRINRRLAKICERVSGRAIVLEASLNGQTMSVPVWL
jgi:hypothetical protein